MPRREYPTGTCEDHGGPMKRVNKATKYCLTCQLGRAAAWHDGRKTTCACGREYIAWRGKSTSMCGECFERHAPNGTRESVVAVCARCRREKRVYSPHVHLCPPCLDEPRNFEGNQRSIIRKHKQLIAEKEAQ